MADKRIYELSTQATPTASDYLAIDKSGNAAAVKTLVGGFLLSSTATTKGDIYAATASATVTRLGVGSNDQVLTADSAEATGMKWASTADSLLADGTTPLTANWDAGAYTITSAGLVLADNESLTLGTGSDATLKWDGTNLVSTLTAGEFQITGGKLLLDNNEPLQIKDTGGTYRDVLYISGGNNVILGMIGTGWGGSTNIYAGSRMYFYVNRATASKGAGLIDPNGRWCIGSNYTPTAVADIDASTTSAASLRLRSGTAPSSPNAGDLWFDGTYIAAEGGARIGDNDGGDYMQVSTAGDVAFVGGAGMTYGEISVVDNSTETAISLAGTAVQVTIFDTDGPSNGATPDHTNDHVTIATAGDYFISVSATVNSIAGADSRFEMTVQKNNGAASVGALHCDRNIGGGAASSGVISMSGIAALSASDTIELWIENETNTQNYVVENIVLTLIQIGG